MRQKATKRETEIKFGNSHSKSVATLKSTLNSKKVCKNSTKLIQVSGNDI